jgi:hypothetical protein
MSSIRRVPQGEHPRYTFSAPFTTPKSFDLSATPARAGVTQELCLVYELGYASLDKMLTDGKKTKDLSRARCAFESQQKCHVR